jgi:adenine phosphoribosyltransferase
MNWKETINEVSDFPQPGVSFKDISPLLKSSHFPAAIKEMKNQIKRYPDYWVGIDARGFVFASALSMLNGGLILCRKKGKLPPPVVSQEYTLEYGNDILEIKPGTGTVVIVDDVYATGGTMNAVEQLCIKAGYTVIDKLVLIDLQFLHEPNNIKSLIKYE